MATIDSSSRDNNDTVTSMNAEVHYDCGQPDSESVIDRNVDVATLDQANCEGKKARCKLCDQILNLGKMVRHLTGHHKISRIVANQMISLKETIKTQKKCPKCGKYQTELRKHLKVVPKETAENINQVVQEVKETNTAKSAEDFSDFELFVHSYASRMSENAGYQEATTYSPKRIENLIRFGRKISEFGYDPMNLFKIPEGDLKKEEEAENIIGKYVTQLKNENKSSETARVYLNDIKLLLNYNYKFRSRKPLMICVDDHLRICKKAHIGKMDLKKYSGESSDYLISAMSQHEKCDFVEKIKKRLAENGTLANKMDLEPRDYLMTSLLTQNFQRPGAIYNMKLKEVNEAVLDTDGDGIQKYCISVCEHKTKKTYGPAKIHLQAQLFSLLKNYIKYWRPNADNGNVFLTRTAGAIDNKCMYHICNAHLKRCNLADGLVFSANSWRRASSSSIQQSGDNELMEAGSRQFTHSRQEQQKSYLNLTSVKRSIKDHSRLYSTVFNNEAIQPTSSHQIESTPSDSDFSHPSRYDIPPHARNYEISMLNTASNPSPAKSVTSTCEFNEITSNDEPTNSSTSRSVASSSEVEVSSNVEPTPTKKYKFKYFRQTDRDAINMKYSEILKLDDERDVKMADLKKMDDPKLFSLLKNGRSVTLSNPVLRTKIYSYLRSTVTKNRLRKEKRSFI